ncbi:Fc.00g080280.m01.CDS01 [Cosmosporella sp. VM-42]
MGRPRKRKLQSQNEDGTANESPQSASERDPNSNSGGESDPNGFEFDPAILMLQDGAGNDLPDWPCEANSTPQSGTTLLNFGSVPAKQNCACLASLYLSLDEIRSTDNMSFAVGLSLLRSATLKAVTVVQCPVCPVKFVWAMQNAQLLNTLILSIAESYQRMVKFIDDEVVRAERTNEQKTLWFGEPQTGLSPENGPGAPSFTLSLSPSEWRTLTKKAVKGEIYGDATLSSASFMSMLQLMEARQLKWHSDGPPVNLHCKAPGEEHDGEPMCVMLVRQARGVVSRLPLDD